MLTTFKILLLDFFLILLWLQSLYYKVKNYLQKLPKEIQIGNSKINKDKCTKYKYFLYHFIPCFTTHFGTLRKIIRVISILNNIK